MDELVTWRVIAHVRGNLLHYMTGGVVADTWNVSGPLYVYIYHVGRGVYSMKVKLHGYEVVHEYGDAKRIAEALRELVEALAAKQAIGTGPLTHGVDLKPADVKIWHYEVRNLLAELAAYERRRKLSRRTEEEEAIPA